MVLFPTWKPREEKDEKNAPKAFKPLEERDEKEKESGTEPRPKKGPPE